MEAEMPEYASNRLKSKNGTSEKKLMSRRGAAGAIILGGFLVFFQNFSVPSRDQGPVAQLVLPAPTGKAVADFPGLPECAMKNTIFLRFKGVASGERVTGSIIDTGTGARIDLDLVAGRDSVAGECEDPTFRDDGIVKICFPGEVGPYFEASLKGDWFQANGIAFASSAFCEASPTVSVDVAVRGGAR